MSYAQTNYPNIKVGNGPYSISEIGCLLTADCNLALKFGITIAPPTLNNFYIDHGDYISDPEDGKGVKDDLSWNSITAYDSKIIVSKEGT